VGIQYKYNMAIHYDLKRDVVIIDEREIKSEVIKLVFPLFLREACNRKVKYIGKHTIGIDNHSILRDIAFFYQLDEMFPEMFTINA